MHVRNGYIAIANVKLSHSENINDVMLHNIEESILHTNRDCEKVELTEIRKTNDQEYEMKFKLFPKLGLSNIKESN